MKVVIGYPNKEEEKQIIRMNIAPTKQNVQPLITPRDIVEVRDIVAQIKGIGGEHPVFRGKGLLLDGMADDLDLAGKPRVRDGKVDLGCYQCWTDPLGILFLVR